jgi:hypothetical protein
MSTYDPTGRNYNPAPEHPFMTGVVHVRKQ